MSQIKGHLYPVDSLEFDYVFTGLSLPQLKKKYNVKCIATLWDYSAAGGWVKKRRDYQESLIDPVFKRDNNLARTISPKTLIDKMELLIDKKLNNELTMGDVANLSDDIKIRCMVANKSKDGISDLTKTVELLKGNPTENILVSDDERTSRRDRLLRMAGNVNNNN